MVYFLLHIFPCPRLKALLVLRQRSLGGPAGAHKIALTRIADRLNEP